MLTKTDVSHQAGALVVMLKESDLLSHTVIESRGLWVVFCQQTEHSDWSGLCSERIGGGRGGHCLGSARSKVKCCHGSIEAQDRKGQRPAAWDSGAWEINARGSCIDSLNICFLLKKKEGHIIVQKELLCYIVFLIRGCC